MKWMVYRGVLETRHVLDTFIFMFSREGFATLRLGSSCFLCAI